LIVLSAAAGREVRRSIISLMGLNQSAAAAVDELTSSGKTAVTGLSVFGVAWLVLGAFGIAATLQRWYRRVYDQPAAPGARLVAGKTIWFLGFLAYLVAQSVIARQVGPLGGHILIFVAEFGLAAGFWTFSPFLLLLGKLRWRALLPGGVGVCIHLGAVFGRMWNERPDSL
jgi:hypothetical protein